MIPSDQGGAPIKLHVNVDHVATLRQARGEAYPDPVNAALLCERAGADGITVHLREDRRHIQDDDVRRLRDGLQVPLNLEMALTDEMVRFAREVRPRLVTLVPENRQERTTEGGLDVIAQAEGVARVVDDLGALGVTVSLFIDPQLDQIDASLAVGARALELHTGRYCKGAAERIPQNARSALEELGRAAAHVQAHGGVTLAAGHGLTLENLPPLVNALTQVHELNIGHALISDALLLGLEAAVQAYRQAARREN